MLSDTIEEHEASVRRSGAAQQQSALLAPGRFRPTNLFMESELDRELTYDQFVTIVEQAARVGREQAERAIRATLQTLAERIDAGEARDQELPAELAPWVAAGGEVDDPRMRLPVALHAPLERGKELTGGNATRMKLEAFVRRVAELEGTPPDAAFAHVRAS